MPKLKSNIFRYQCPKCKGYSTCKSGKNSAGTQMIRCYNCQGNYAVKPTPLKDLECVICGKKQVRIRKYCTCSPCYQRRYRNRQKLDYALNFKYPDNFDIDIFLDIVSKRYIPHDANIRDMIDNFMRGK